MNMVSVNSSNITSVGYEANKLYVQFKNGGLWRYDGVPVSLYNSLMNSPSKGKFFADFIKNAFPPLRIG